MAKKIKNNKLLLFIPGIITLLLVSALVYVKIFNRASTVSVTISQSPFPTTFPDKSLQIPSDWKTYTFPDESLSFKYPPEGTLTSEPAIIVDKENFHLSIGSPIECFDKTKPAEICGEEAAASWAKHMYSPQDVPVEVPSKYTISIQGNKGYLFTLYSNRYEYLIFNNKSIFYSLVLDNYNFHNGTSSPLNQYSETTLRMIINSIQFH